MPRRHCDFPKAGPNNFALYLRLSAMLVSWSLSVMFNYFMLYSVVDRPRACERPKDFPKTLVFYLPLSAMSACWSPSGMLNNFTLYSVVDIPRAYEHLWSPEGHEDARKQGRTTMCCAFSFASSTSSSTLLSIYHLCTSNPLMHTCTCTDPHHLPNCRAYMYTCIEKHENSFCNFPCSQLALYTRCKYCVQFWILLLG